jgi:catechol 2,3-dioxygenase-like lactoylglutathione lyase family enzyme
MSDLCAVTGLFHVLVKTNDLQQTLRFYKGVLGLREAKRPPFGNPGAWLMCPQPSGGLIIHVWAGGPLWEKNGPSPDGTAAIDHVSLTAIGHTGFRQRFAAADLPWREGAIPDTTLFQMFVYDPNGVQIELTFDLDAEAPLPPIPPAHQYDHTEKFFDRARYPLLS